MIDRKILEGGSTHYIKYENGNKAIVSYLMIVSRSHSS